MIGTGFWCDACVEEVIEKDIDKRDITAQQAEDRRATLRKKLAGKLKEKQSTMRRCRIDCKVVSVKVDSDGNLLRAYKPAKPTHPLDTVIPHAGASMYEGIDPNISKNQGHKPEQHAKPLATVTPIDVEDYDRRSGRFHGKYAESEDDADDEDYQDPSSQTSKKRAETSLRIRKNPTGVKKSITRVTREKESTKEAKKTLHKTTSKTPLKRKKRAAETDDDDDEVEEIQPPQPQSKKKRRV